jgi:hypothetical protein
LIKLRVGALAVNPLKSQDFHLISTAGSCCPGSAFEGNCRRTLLQQIIYSASENALPLLGLAENPAQAEAEDSSKIKDRLEALLFAETLQETLSPNANPGKGSVGGFTEFDARSHREDSAGCSDTSSLVLDLTVIPK